MQVEQLFQLFFSLCVFIFSIISSGNFVYICRYLYVHKCTNKRYFPIENANVLQLILILPFRFRFCFFFFHSYASIELKTNQNFWKVKTCNKDWKIGKQSIFSQIFAANITVFCWSSHFSHLFFAYSKIPENVSNFDFKKILEAKNTQFSEQMKCSVKPQSRSECINRYFSFEFNMVSHQINEQKIDEKVMKTFNQQE